MHALMRDPLFGHSAGAWLGDPGEPPLYTTTFDRDDANLGAFKLGTDAVSRAKWWTPCPLPKLELPPKSFGVIQNNAKIIDGLLYILPPKQRKEKLVATLVVEILAAETLAAATTSRSRRTWRGSPARCTARCSRRSSTWTRRATRRR